MQFNLIGREEFDIVEAAGDAVAVAVSQSRARCWISSRYLRSLSWVRPLKDW